MRLPWRISGPNLAVGGSCFAVDVPAAPPVDWAVPSPGSLAAVAPSSFPVLSAVGAGVALALIVVVVLVIAASGSSSPTTAFDISYPQCSGSYPLNPLSGIVGVNGELAKNANPCISGELHWAGGAPAQTDETAAHVVLHRHR